MSLAERLAYNANDPLNLTGNAGVGMHEEDRETATRQGRFFVALRVPGTSEVLGT